MTQYQSIFDTLNDVRVYLEGEGLGKSISAIDEAENIALSEIYGINSNASKDDSYASVMALVFRHIEGKLE